jgi:hypothetical protein
LGTPAAGAGRHNQTAAGAAQFPLNQNPNLRNNKMADKRDVEKEKETATDEKPLPVKLVAGSESQPIARVRSDTEQSIIDTLGDDPSKFKEGTREHDLVQSLPENIAKKQAEGKTAKSTEGGSSSEASEEDLEEHTVAELKEIAEKKGVQIPWDANKSDIIKAIKKGK